MILADLSPSHPTRIVAPHPGKLVIFFTLLGQTDDVSLQVTEGLGDFLAERGLIRCEDLADEDIRLRRRNL